MKRSFETSLHVSRRTYFWQLYVSQDSTNGSPADIEAGDDLGFADIGAAEFSSLGGPALRWAADPVSFPCAGPQKRLADAFTLKISCSNSANTDSRPTIARPASLVASFAAGVALERWPGLGVCESGARTNHGLLMPPGSSPPSVAMRRCVAARSTRSGASWWATKADASVIDELARPWSHRSPRASAGRSRAGAQTDKLSSKPPAHRRLRRATLARCGAE
jgi:hypothetical protein